MENMYNHCYNGTSQDNEFMATCLYQTKDVVTLSRVPRVPRLLTLLFPSFSCKRGIFTHFPQPGCMLLLYTMAGQSVYTFFSPNVNHAFPCQIRASTETDIRTDRGTFTFPTALK